MPTYKKVACQTNRLDTLDYKILALLIKEEKINHSAIAKLLKSTRETITRRINRPIFQDKLLSQSRDTWETILTAQREAAHKLAELLHSDDERIVLEASKLLLGPILNKGEIKVHQVSEIVYRTRIGKQGMIIQEKDEITGDVPKDTIQLLNRQSGEISDFSSSYEGQSNENHD